MRDFWSFFRTNIFAAFAIILAGAGFGIEAFEKAETVSGFPTWLLEVAAAFIFICAVVSILFKQHKTLQSYKSIASSTSSTEVATPGLVSAIAQMIYVRDIRQDIEKRATDAEIKWATFLEKINASGSGKPPTQWKAAYTAWTNDIKVIQKIALDSMNVKKEFLESVNFYKNPGVQVLNEQNLETEADKYELRRAYDEHRTAISAIQALRNILASKESTRKIAIINAAKPSVIEAKV